MSNLKPETKAAFRAAVREIGAINAAPYITAEELRERLRDSLGKRWGGLTQRDVAKRCGVSEAFLSAVLRGHKDPGNTIAKAFRYERVVLYRKIAQEGSKP